MWCHVCSKGKKRNATHTVKAYVNLQGGDEYFCCEEHAPVLAMRLAKEAEAVAIRKILGSE